MNYPLNIIQSIEKSLITVQAFLYFLDKNVEANQSPYNGDSYGRSSEKTGSSRPKKLCKSYV